MLPDFGTTIRAHQWYKQSLVGPILWKKQFPQWVIAATATRAPISNLSVPISHLHTRIYKLCMYRICMNIHRHIDGTSLYLISAHCRTLSDMFPWSDWLKVYPIASRGILVWLCWKQHITVLLNAWSSTPLSQRFYDIRTPNWNSGNAFCIHLL